MSSSFTDKVIGTIHDVIDAELLARDATLTKDIGKIVSDYTGRGTLSSSMAVGAIQERFTLELQKMAEVLLNEITEAVEDFGNPIGIDQSEVASKLLDSIYSRLHSRLIHETAVTQVEVSISTFEQERDRVRQRLDVSLRQNEAKRNRKILPAGLPDIFSEMIEWILNNFNKTKSWPDQGDFEAYFLDNNDIIGAAYKLRFLRRPSGGKVLPTAKGLLLSEAGVSHLHLIQKILDGLLALLRKTTTGKHTVRDLQEPTSLSAEDVMCGLSYASPYGLLSSSSGTQYDISEFTISKDQAISYRRVEDLVAQDERIAANEKGVQPQENVLHSTFGSYTLQKQIGEGGSGIVYEAIDASEKQWVIKILKRDEKTPSDKVERFKREILFCAQPQHPNIICINDHGPYQFGSFESSFYVMPRYDVSLRSLIKKKIPPEEVLPLILQILDGIEAAHLKVIFHRDLKPENILIDLTTKRLVIADFGIAHIALSDEVNLTNTGDFIGNRDYSAPEQRHGNNVDHRCDIYALSMILNETFTGEKPFGDGYKKIGQAVPEYAWLDPLVEWMHSQDPDKRPESIAVIKQWISEKGNLQIAGQKLDSITNQVISETEIDDPLALTPVSLTARDYENGILTLYLSQAVTDEWIGVFRKINYERALWNKGPQNFQFQGYKSLISCKDDVEEIQQVINDFKRFLDLANTDYQSYAERLNLQRIGTLKRKREQAIENAKRRLEILSKTKI